MTVRELGYRMDHAELVEWMALDEIKGDEAERRNAMAKKGMKSTRRR